MKAGKSIERQEFNLCESVELMMEAISNDIISVTL